jgi:hypothetical protein
LYQREGISILDRSIVEATVINAESQGAVLLPDEQDGGSGRGRRGLDESLGQVFLDPFLKSKEFFAQESIKKAERGFESGFQVDRVVIFPVRR